MNDRGRQSADFYDVRYATDLQALQDRVFAEVYDDYFGQSSWVATVDYDRCRAWLALDAGSRLLDIACGWGAPALRLARLSGCSVVGIDVNPQAVARARELAGRQGLDGRVRFECHDAGRPLPFADAAFDGLSCMDALIHLPERPSVLREWRRVLKPGGRLVFTDQVMTGPLSNREVAVRAPFAHFLLAAPGYNEGLLADAAFELMHREDLTPRLAEIAERHCRARQRHAEALRALEGEEAFEALNRYRALAHRLAVEKRLSHVAFVAKAAP